MTVPAHRSQRSHLDVILPLLSPLIDTQSQVRVVRVRNLGICDIESAIQNQMSQETGHQGTSSKP